MLYFARIPGDGRLGSCAGGRFGGSILKIGLFAVAVAAIAGDAAAGDAVGWMRVSVPSNDVAGVILPFSPIAGAK